MVVKNEHGKYVTRKTSWELLTKFVIAGIVRELCGLMLMVLTAI